MGFLRRVLGGRSAPAWAAFMTGEQYEAFAALLDADLRARGWTFTRRDDGVFVERAGTEPQAFGLTNIAQLCAAIDREQWAGAIKAHFDHFGDLARQPDPAETFEAVRPLLRLRVLPADVADEHQLVAYPLAPGLVAVLAIDYPTTVNTPRRDGIGDWPPVDELHAIALANLGADPLPGVETVEANGVAISLFFDDSFFTASRLLLLRDLPGMAGHEHALVAVPNRHTLLVHPIADMRSIGAVAPIASMAAHGHRTGPGSISPDVFWWHAGALTRIPATVRDKGIDVFPPDAFMQLLETLPPPPER